MQNRRTKHLIDKQVQGRLLLSIAGHWLLYFILVLCAIPMWHMITVTGLSKPFPAVLLESWTQMTPVFFFLLAVLPIFVWETTKLSNRFAGPMYRLHKTIRKLNDGEKVSPIQCREGDFWQEVLEDFNTTIARLEQQQTARPPQEEEEPVAVG